MTDTTSVDMASIQPITICLGTHPAIIQSMLDYAYCIGAENPTVLAIISRGRKQERYFWGEKEISIPVYAQLADVPPAVRNQVMCLLNIQSARRVLAGMTEALNLLPKLRVATVFAEQVPESHSLQLADMAAESGVLLSGPASVGVLVPGILKLGAIGGTEYSQLAAAGIFEAGNTAVISTSGGMVNELIHTVITAGLRVSVAIALGGDRYPLTSPAAAFLMAQADPRTEQIVYFGELGGVDEYAIAELISAAKVTKPVIAYVAGTVAELFAEPPQFGHAKAMASTHNETASAKKDALRAVGVNVLDAFGDLVTALKAQRSEESVVSDFRAIGPRRKSLAVSHISGDVNGDVQLLGRDLLAIVEDSSLAGLYISLLLGHEVASPRLIALTDYILRLLTDHGPYVAGAFNTIVAARAGKDVASSLASGILTIGPRFGGAVNAAAGAWLEGVASGESPKVFVAGYRSNGGIISGIGHKKYRIDMPDPRVKALIEQFSSNTNGDNYLKFAQGVEAITTTKKGNLILNVDGAIAAIMLDVLVSELDYNLDQLQELVDIEFFNALFILSRSVGFVAHYLDQRRNDEGLLRLSDDEIAYAP